MPILHWLVWLSGINTTKGSVVEFQVREHAWVASRGCTKGNYTLKFLFKIDFRRQLSQSPTTTLPWPNHHHLPISNLSPLVLSMGPLHLFFDDSFPSFPHYIPPTYPLVTVSLFFISMSLVIFFLLVCFVD